jgi:hypothetical protein
VKWLAISQNICCWKGQHWAKALYYICRQLAANETSYSVGDKHMSRDHTLYFAWKGCRFFHPLLLMDDVFPRRHISRNKVFVRTSLRCLFAVSSGWTRKLEMLDYFHFLWMSSVRWLLRSKNKVDSPYFQTEKGYAMQKCSSGLHCESYKCRILLMGIWMII